MQKITRGTCTRYAFDYHDEPVMQVKPGIADIKAPAGGNQGFQKQITIVVAP